MAYFQFAERGEQQAGQKAMLCYSRLSAAAGSNQIGSAHSTTASWSICRRPSGGHKRNMKQLYSANPANSVAAGDLAILQARAGDAKGAVAGCGG